jgi:hypothetical protein
MITIARENFFRTPVTGPLPGKNPFFKRCFMRVGLLGNSRQQGDTRAFIMYYEQFA